MKKKILILFLIALAIDFLMLGCKPQHCKGRFSDLRIGIGYSISDSSFQHYINNVLITNFDSTVIQQLLNIQDFNCTYNSNSGFFIQKAYALTIPKFVTLTDTVISYNIYTIRNYNSNYLASANINDIVIHSFSNKDWASTKIQTNKIVDEYKKYNANDLDKYSFVGHSSKLTQKPTNSGDTVQLAVEYGLADGRVLRDTSEKFILTY